MENGVLTEQERKQALTALEAFRDRSTRGAKVDNIASVDQELLVQAELSHDERLGIDGRALTWGALSKRIRDLGKTRGKYADSTLRVVEYLLSWSRAQGIAPSSHPPPGTGLAINCPNTIFNHRAVIVGQLPPFDPRAQLYPAVFVKPNDGSGFWYPQCGPHNPLLVDRAFACLVHFGNPNAIWHRRRLPTRFEVRVYALRKKWTDSRRLAEAGSLSAVTPLRDQALAQHALDFVERTGDDDVTRNAPGIDALRMADANGDLVPSENKEMECTAPFTISWDGSGGARLEIRSGDSDHKVWEDAVASGVTLTTPDRPRPIGGEAGATLAAGLYRVRLYPQKPSFLDPEWEWWLRMK